MLICALALTQQVFAQDVYVPPDLSQWQEWVLHDHEYVSCPLAGNQYRCLWPGRLNLNVNSSGGRFTQVVEVFDAQYFTLPGDSEHWPLDVTVNGDSVPVVERNARPMLYLETGEHTIAGSFRWVRSPDTLPLGNGTGLLALEINGTQINRPRWNANEVWISQGQQAETQQTENQMNVSVYRLIADGAPVNMTVRVQLDIAGESREEVIGQLVPDGFTPADLKAPLPARLDDDGNLKIQARPGSWVFSFKAHKSAPLERLTFTPRGVHWPKEEVWSYRAAPSIRATEVRADKAVDPVQSGVPNEWQRFPAFQMNTNDEMQVIERQRGRAVGESNRLTLHRDLWLDFDRDGFTARDSISGNMVREWRLDLAAPFQLESASMQSPQDGKVNLLVTKNPVDSAVRGVEIRSPVVNMTALSRMDKRDNQLPVGGWNTRFDSVTTQLILPPGHRLLAVSNVDRARGAWIEKWNLLDFFVVMIVTVAVWRLIAPWAGVVALLALALSFHESGAPQLAWLNLVAAFALLKYLPEGRLRSLIRNYSLLSVIAIAVILIPFAAQALKTAVYPQLEYRGSIQNYEARPTAEMRQSMDQLQTPEAGVAARYANDAEEVIVTASKRNKLSRYAANARVQTGPGLPSWQWANNQLYWNGPVDVAQTSRLWIVSPFLMRLWRVCMVGLLAALLAGFVVSALSWRKRHSRTAGSSGGSSGSAALWIASLIATSFLVGPTPPAYAETPSAQVLEQLRDRLLAQPECVPNCVDVSRARVTLTEDELRIELIAHAQAYAVLQLPGRMGAWMPERVSINGQATDDLRINESGTSEVRLDAGVHRIDLIGSLPNANTMGIAFPDAPHHVEVAGDGWEVTGLANNRLTGSALTLIRQQTGRERTALDAVDVEQFPAFVSIHRELRFDLDWSVTTTVRRITPPNAAINLTIPLLAGESITQDDIEQNNQMAQISIPTGVQSVSWSSTMVRESTIELVAAENQPWQEHWQLIAGDSWRLSFKGVPELNTNRQQDARWVARFTPWPGENLTLNLSRPDAVDGSTTAIDQVTLTETAGMRSSTVALEFSYRATRGTQHTISLPVESELTAVMIDGQVRNLALEQGKLRLPIVPGTHSVRVEWRTAERVAFHTRIDEVDLGMPASNINLNLVMPNSRWSLWTHGPQLGPAVLYWSELLVLIAIALMLARFGRTPLKLHHWVLLGLGFSTFFWPAFAIVAAAILALAWRGTRVLAPRWLFNTVQVLLTLLVIGAGFALVGAIPYGLLGEANMHITGNYSHATHLKWFIDQSSGVLPSAGVFSLPTWIYKVLILLWALWLAFALLRWLPWMWQNYGHEGFWRAKQKVLAPPDTDNPDAERRV